jgi:hypothetical protein
MKWESVTHTLGYSVYALWNNGRKLVTLVYNYTSGAARIEYEDERRVFLIRKEGFMKNKTVLRNEYGVRIGHAGTENNELFIELDNERFFYFVDNKEEPSVTIYKESKDQPLAVCGLNIEKGKSLKSFGKDKIIRDDAHYSLLMTLCWYLFHPVKKEDQLQVA